MALSIFVFTQKFLFLTVNKFLKLSKLKTTSFHLNIYSLSSTESLGFHRREV